MRRKSNHESEEGGRILAYEGRKRPVPLDNARVMQCWAAKYRQKTEEEDEDEIWDKLTQSACSAGNKVTSLSVCVFITLKSHRHTTITRV